MTADGEIAREGRRILRLLDAPGAHLRPDGASGWRAVLRADAAKYAGFQVASAIVDAFVRRGWVRRGTVDGTFVLSDAGQGWLRRAASPDEPFAAQHQLRRRKLIRDDSGVEQPALVDDAESPLARLKQRRLIDAAQFEAGEKLRRDFTLAGLSPRLGVDYSAPLQTHARGKLAQRQMSELVLAAKQRFQAAMRAVGPGLSDLLFDVCCHWRGLEEAEQAKGWPGRSGRVVLGIALDRLADHYGMRVSGRGRLRAWAMQEGE